MINIFSAYKNGLVTVWKEKKLLFWVYGFNLIFAYVLAMPISMMLSRALAKTTAAEKMLESFDYAIYSSIMEGFGQGISLGRLLISIGLFYMILNIFLSGGILSALIKGQKLNITEFLSECVLYFNRFLKLFLISLVLLLMVFLLNMLLSRLFGYFTEEAATEHLSIILFMTRVIILVIVLAFINLLFDYAKIMTVVYDYHKMMETVKLALMFIMMSLIKTVGLYKLYLFTAVGIFLLYWVVESALQVSSGFMVLVFFIWTQIYMILKLWVRLGFFAGQYSFYYHSNTAMPGMSKAMLDEAVANYEIHLKEAE